MSEPESDKRFSLSMRSSRLRTYVVVSLLLLGGFALRVYRLDEQSLWEDEIHSVLRANASLPVAIEDILSAGNQAPLYFVVLHFWQSLGDDELVVPLVLANQVRGFLQASERPVSVPFSEDDLITLQLMGRHVLFWLRNILGASEDDRSLAHIDYSTNLYNYRYFCKRLKTELLQAELPNESLSLLMIDLDEYKRINDTYGHQIGNAVLVQIASLFQLAVRETDVVCRYGGDEFVVILPHSDKEQALNVARRLEAELRARQVEIPGAGLISIPSLTIGVSTFPIPASSGEELIRQADEALYVAKGGLPGMRHGFDEEKASDVAP